MLVNANFPPQRKSKERAERELRKGLERELGERAKKGLRVRELI